MNAAGAAWEHALDQPGSAGRATLRHAVAFAAVIVLMTAVVLFFGPVQLPAFPQFTIFHTGFVFLVDAITAFLLFGQFVYRRLPCYLLLAAAFLFNALVMIPFLLSFPEALAGQGQVLGGSQSSIWVWHFWHALFPAIVALALVVDERGRGRTVPPREVVPVIAAVTAAVLLLVVLVSLAVTVFHHRLPVLIDEHRVPLRQNFYWVGAVAAAVTALAFALAARLARRRAVLHVWLTLVLLAFLADEAASLGAYPRYALGWYFGRVESMLATGTLLAVFLTDINHLYYRLARALRDLSGTNRKLSATIDEKDALLAELRESEERVRRMAYYDAITELPNRRWLMEALARTLAVAERHGHATAVLFVDLDRFKEVNDSLGHEVGDGLLREVAGRLERCVRAADTVSRLGGDEFVIVLPEIAGPRDATAVADKILRAMAEPMTIAGHVIRITASIGIAIGTREHRLDAADLVRRADEAMYAAKKSGRNRKALSAFA